MARKTVRVGKIVIRGVTITLVCVLPSTVFYLGAGGRVLRLRNDRSVVETTEALTCTAKNIMTDEMALGKTRCNKTATLSVLTSCVDLTKARRPNISAPLCIRWVNVGTEKTVIVTTMPVTLSFNIVIIVTVSKTFGKVNSIL